MCLGCLVALKSCTTTKLVYNSLVEDFSASADTFHVGKSMCNIFFKGFMHLYLLTLVLLNPDILCFANSVDPDQLASEEAN